MPWTRALHISQWADQRSAQDALPVLVRRLIRADVPSLREADFPAGEQVSRPGVDGRVDSPIESLFVPRGRSFWELGTDKNQGSKANADFQKRTQQISEETQRESTFVFVTPRSWRGKNEWASQAANTGKWKRVVAIDANDLEQWLERYPALDIWFSRISGRPTEGVQDLAGYWSSLRSIARSDLGADVFLASREDSVEALTRWLSGPPASLLVRSDGSSDALDFIAALSSAEDSTRILRDALIVDDRSAWITLSQGDDSLLLIAGGGLLLDPADAALAVNNGKWVICCASAMPSSEVHELALPRQESLAVERALGASGFSASESKSLANSSCGSTSILKRRLSRHPISAIPAWARQDEGVRLAPVALVGGWNRDSDTWLIAELLGVVDEAVIDLVSRWSKQPDPLFLELGSFAFVASREDAWTLLSAWLTPSHLTRFSNLAELILCVDDPSFELPPDQRWLAPLFAKKHEVSTELRQSVVETLALISTLSTGGHTRQAEATQIPHALISSVLPADSSWRRWASLGGSLPVLAEAAPREFIARIEDDLASSDPELPKLFQDNNANELCGAVHCDLLRSLETLAWDPEFLPRATLALAQLAALDPGGRYANRPARSLREIFQFWLPHTCAPATERVAALRAILSEEENVGWNLLLDCFPQRSPAYSTSTRMPRWRQWASGWTRGSSQTENAEYGCELLSLTCSAAGVRPSRWVDLVRKCVRSRADLCGEILAGLEFTLASGLREEDKFSLWNAFRMVGALDPSNPAEEGDADELESRVGKLFAALWPQDPALAHSWLFEHFPVLRRSRRGDERDDDDTLIDKLRLNALKEVCDHAGCEGIERLARNSENHRVIGSTLARGQLLAPVDLSIPQSLADDGSSLHYVCAGFVTQLFLIGGLEAIEDLDPNSWQPGEIAGLALRFPFDREVWDWVDSLSTEASIEYWSRTTSIGAGSKESTERSVHELLRVERPRQASRVLAFSDPSAIDSELAAVVLGRIIQASSDENRIDEDAAHSITTLIRALQDDSQFALDRMAELEWQFMPLLNERWGVRSKALVIQVREDPKLFHDLIKTCYVGETEPAGAASALDSARANHAQDLIEQLRGLPGTDREGEWNKDLARDWITEARSRAAESGHTKILDVVIGQWLGERGGLSTDEDSQVELLELLAEIGTEKLFEGIHSGIFNSNGSFSRDVFAGGQRERDLALRYKGMSDRARSYCSELADVYDSLSRFYENAAGAEDDDAERRRLSR